MIPAEAVEAALDAFANAPYDPPPITEAQMKRANREQMRLALEAAAPHIIAGYFREINSKAIAHELENPPNFSKDAP